MKPPQKTKLNKLQQKLAETQTTTFPADPAEFCQTTLGFTPTNYQKHLMQLFQQNQFVAARWARQTGKSHTISALLLHYALTNPNTNTAIVGPSWRQTKLIIKRVNGLLHKLPKGTYQKPQKTTVTLTNNSTIEAYPNNPETIRGPTLHIVYCLPRHVNIVLPDGNRIPISRLNAGQHVLSYNPLTRQVEPKKVLRIFPNPLDDRNIVRVFHSFGHLDCTAEHKISTLKRGYVPASQLTINDQILYLAGTPNHETGAKNKATLQAETDRNSRTTNLWRALRRPMHTKTKKREKKRPRRHKPLLKTSRIRSIQILNSSKPRKKTTQTMPKQRLGKTTNKIQHSVTSIIHTDLSHMLSRWAKNNFVRMARKNRLSTSIGNMVHGRWKSFKIGSSIQHSQILQTGKSASSTMAEKSLENRLKNSERLERQRILFAALSKGQRLILRSNQITGHTSHAIQNLAGTEASPLHNMRQASSSQESSPLSEKESCLLRSEMQETLGKIKQKLATKTAKSLRILWKDLRTDTRQNKNVFVRLSEDMENSTKKTSETGEQGTVIATTMFTMRQPVHSQKWAPENLQRKMPQRKTQKILENPFISKALHALRQRFSSSVSKTEILQCRMSGKTALFQKKEQNEIVYNLEVEGNHNFFADGILVSNCDEFNFIPNDAEMYDAILFTLGTTNGKFVCTSTPWSTDSTFHKIFHDTAYADYAKSHVTWQQALEPNGPLKQQIIERIRKQLEGDPCRWKREMEAEWAENENAWLPQALITSCIDHTLEYTSFEENPKGSFFAGLDLGKHQDHSVLAILKTEDTTAKLVHLRTFPLQTSYASVIGYVKTIRDRWQTIHKILVDVSGVGDYVTEDMTNTGIAETEGAKFTQETKEKMATHLKQCMIENKLKIPYDSDLIAELNTERFELAKDGKLKLNHPENTHDDRFWALALACYATRTEPAPKLWIARRADKAKTNWKQSESTKQQA